MYCLTFNKSTSIFELKIMYMHKCTLLSFIIEVVHQFYSICLNVLPARVHELV